MKVLYLKKIYSIDKINSINHHTHLNVDYKILYHLMTHSVKHEIYKYRIQNDLRVNIGKKL